MKPTITSILLSTFIILTPYRTDGYISATKTSVGEELPMDNFNHGETKRVARASYIRKRRQRKSSINNERVRQLKSSKTPASSSLLSLQIARTIRVGVKDYVQ